MNKQELANRVYEAMQRSKQAYYKKDWQSLDHWQGILQPLIEGMTSKQANKLADSADLTFRKSIMEGDYRNEK